MTSEDKRRKLILAIPAIKLQTVDADSDGFEGFTHATPTNIMNWLRDAGAWFGPRADLELDESFLQIIPYIVLVKNGAVVRYLRTSTGGEGRLHGRTSVGVGGHIDLCDAVEVDGLFDVEATLMRAATREIEEELNGVSIVKKTWVGFLFDGSNSVGRVHLGVVGIWELESDLVGSAEDAVANVESVKVCDLDPKDPRWENWSASLIADVRFLKKLQTLE